MSAQLDPVVLNDWFVVSAAHTLLPGEPLLTQLLGVAIAVWREADDSLHAARHGADEVCGKYKVCERYGYIWVSLGKPVRDIYSLPEFTQPGRRFVDCGSFGVKASGLRIIENFLDMGHFPFVHTDILGKEPHTEVKDYKVETDAETQELWATECRFWQPRAAASATDGLDVEYTYRVMQPFTSALYKTCPTRADERDVIGLYVQPVSEEECKVALWMLLFDDMHTDGELIAFQQTIFGQDKPILESQLPKLIPLDPRSEIPTRADASSIAYRRWLREIGLQYGVQKAA
ncbi:(2Fe-2S)-binding protein [Herminiimonas sp. KBW02]|uniref:aromatic ring-hydroxylating oxygenase subunit alpha n=1 Tax=Herminiimonas sp. KBW02 TaxID=2153363 RepID=UPI000F59752B|nr:aromatic ring-hydroxylating dioxygenase subunit alpha [Herminiimonas sp. KBW02]RQO36415.1 (2Fe-2S)-binding protein [Herminiimonas sp. KBW02]